MGVSRPPRETMAVRESSGTLCRFRQSSTSSRRNSYWSATQSKGASSSAEWVMDSTNRGSSPSKTASLVDVEPGLRIKVAPLGFLLTDFGRPRRR